MIYMNRLNGEEFITNADLIEFIEATPDTVVTLTTGKKVIVTQSPHELIERIVSYKRRITPCVRQDKDVYAE